MKKLENGKIQIKEIKHLENSRMRNNPEDIAELTNDIKMRGLLINIGIRKSDNTLIYGNRRLRAFELLGYESIPCDFYDCTDEELLVLNLIENIKRRTIGSIEIGRIANILINKDMTSTEIAVKLGISKSRIDSCIAAYKVTLGTAFEDIIMYGNRGLKRKGIPEGIIWRIQNSLTRARPLTKVDWDILLREIEKGNFTQEHISPLRNILLANNKLSINRALEILEQCKVIHIFLHFKKEELAKCLKETKCRNGMELVIEIIKKYNSKLLF